MFALTQALELYDIYQAKVADCDVRLKVILDRLKAASDKPMPSTTAMATWSGAACSSAWITPLNEQQAP
jgi:transposase